MVARADRMQQLSKCKLQGFEMNFQGWYSKTLGMKNHRMIDRPLLVVVDSRKHNLVEDIKPYGKRELSPNC
jgi:hypothetical protein